MSLAGGSHAADIKERTIKFAFVQNMDNRWGAGTQKFAEIVNQKSDGKIKVKLFAGGTLGRRYPDALFAPGRHDRDGHDGLGRPGRPGVKEYVLFDLPVPVRGPRRRSMRALDGPLGKKLMDRLPEKGPDRPGRTGNMVFRSLTNSRRPVGRSGKTSRA